MLSKCAVSRLVHLDGHGTLVTVLIHLTALLKVSVHLQGRKVGSLVKFMKRTWRRGTRLTNWN